MMNEPYRFETLSRWAQSCKEPDALKGTSRLTTIKGDKQHDCCLGRMCRMLGLPSKVFNPDYPKNSKMLEWGKNGDTNIMPQSVAKELNITGRGYLTGAGRETAERVTGKCLNVSDLAIINDNAYSSDETLYNMGVLIENLLVQEYLFGVPQFCVPQFLTE